MLRSVVLENFVGFETKQCIRFPEKESPSIFVGENGSGKSSLLEGIRRCLSCARSTTRSSSYDEASPSYFICQYDTSKCSEINDQLLFSGVLTDKLPDKTYYKFLSTSSALLIDKHTPLVDERIPDGVHHFQSADLSVTQDAFDIIKETVQRPEGSSLVPIANTVTDRMFSEIEERSLEQRLKVLENYIVMTLPLRSIGPLQWSKSERIAADQREKNYLEASQRAEIITYFLARKDEFDVDKENEYFRGLTGRSDIEFELADDQKRIIVKSTETKLPGDEYALLKTPEGILEAKHFSILMSSKQFLTVILEEPDRGMHPQMIDRMMSIIGKEKENKQIVLTTHNPCFVHPTTISKLSIFKRLKPEGNGKVHTKIIPGTKIVTRRFDSKALKPDGKGKVETKPSCSTIKNTAKEESHASMKDLRILTQDHLADLIFAKKILFCEGDSDFLFLTGLKDRVMEPSKGVLHVLDLMKAGPIGKLQNEILSMQIISINGWSNAKTMHKVCRELELDHAFLFDKDAIIDSKTGRLISHSFAGYQAIEQEFRKVNLTDDVNWYNIRKKLKNINIYAWRDGTIEDMLLSLIRNDTKRVKLPAGTENIYDCEVSWREKRKLIEVLEEQNVCLPIGKWKEKRPKLRDPKDGAAEKMFINSAVNQENITESVELFLNACDNISNDLVQFIDFLAPLPRAEEPSPSTSGASSIELGCP